MGQPTYIPRTYPGRYCLSVGGARVDGAAFNFPTMETGTEVNNAGGFNGAGTGDKAIMGCRGHNGLALGAITSITWEWEEVSLETEFLPYVNLVVDLGGGVYRIFPIDPLAAGPLNTGVLSVPATGRHRFTHIPGTHFVQVVNAFTVAPFVSPPVPVAAGAGPVWNNASFAYADILAAFPTAALADVSSLDGGLPKNTITPGLLLCVGDSVNLKQHTYRIIDFQINGASA